MPQRYVTASEAEMLDALDSLPMRSPRYSAAVFTARLVAEIASGADHPLTRAAAFVEEASFQTPVERGETPAPTPTEF